MIFDNGNYDFLEAYRSLQTEVRLLWTAFSPSLRTTITLVIRSASTTVCVFARAN